MTNRVNLARALLVGLAIASICVFIVTATDAQLEREVFACGVSVALMFAAVYGGNALGAAWCAVLDWRAR